MGKIHMGSIESMPKLLMMYWPHPIIVAEKFIEEGQEFERFLNIWTTPTDRSSKVAGNEEKCAGTKFTPKNFFDQSLVA
jgi:hypothetical protein